MCCTTREQQKQWASCLQGQQQQRVAWPAVSWPATTHNAKQSLSISDAVGVKRMDYLMAA